MRLQGLRLQQLVPLVELQVKVKILVFLGDWLWDMTPKKYVVLVKNAGNTVLDNIANSEHYQRESQSNFVEWHLAT